jgi:hypothetical protein
MSRADEVRARFDAELAVVELEEELVALKESGDADALADCKLRLREARQAWRELRAGDAVVTPSTIETTAGVQEVGQ